MDKDSPILVRVFKEESELEVWKQDRTGRFALLKTYPICRWSGELGPKIKEGDRQAPEGFYTITPGPDEPELAVLSVVQPRLSQRLRPRARPHRRASDGARRLLVARLLLDDRRADRGNLRARPRGVLRRPEIVPGAGLSVPHDARRTWPSIATIRTWRSGRCSSRATTISRSAKLEPKVDVCEKHYVFDAQDPGDPSRPLSFSAAGKCPVFEVAGRHRARGAGQAAPGRNPDRRADRAAARRPRRSRPAPTAACIRCSSRRSSATRSASRRRAASRSPQPPGTIPATVRPPRIPELADAPVVAGSRQRRSQPPGSARSPTDGDRRAGRRRRGGEARGAVRQPVRQPVLVEVQPTPRTPSDRRRRRRRPGRPDGAAHRPAQL